MKAIITHTNGKIDEIKNFKELLYTKNSIKNQFTIKNIDDFRLEVIAGLTSITFIGDSIIVIPQKNIESLKFVE